MAIRSHRRRRMEPWTVADYLLAAALIAALAAPLTWLAICIAHFIASPY